jgi:rhamnogalacturonan endolyase
LSADKKHLTRRRVLGASATGVAATGAAVAGGPRVTVNDWVSAIPTAPSRPSTRSLTTGSYRGNNHTITFSVPSSGWKTDVRQYNVLKLDVVSGSGGTGFLGAGTSFDCIDLLA